MNSKVTIIIVSLNNENTIEQTLISVLNQTYKNLEVIVIDGLSDDGTVDIVKQYSEKYSNVLKYMSENDSGISDAFNKGIKLSTGDYINFQGADDYFLSDDAIENVMENIDKNKDILVCGKIKRVSTDGKKVLWTTKAKFTKKSLLFRMSLPHQALFTNKAFFNKYGVFSTKYIFSMDYELLLRAYNTFPKVIIKDVFVSAWRDGGIGSNSVFEILNEYYRIKLKNKVANKYLIKFIYIIDLCKVQFKHMIPRGIYGKK